MPSPLPRSLPPVGGDPPHTSSQSSLLDPPLYAQNSSHIYVHAGWEFPWIAVTNVQPPKAGQLRRHNASHGKFLKSNSLKQNQR